MTEAIQILLNNLKSKEYKKERREIPEPEYRNFYDLDGYVENFKEYIANEVPIIHENDDFGFNIGVTYKIEQVYGNMTPNYYKIVSQGLDSIRNQISSNIEQTDDEDKQKFGKAMIDCIDAFLDLCDRYKELALKENKMKLYNALCKVPHGAAESFYEACVFID